MCDTTIGQNAIETWKKKECSSFGYFSKAANFTVLLEQLMQSDSSLIVNPSFLPTVKGLYKNPCTMKLTWQLRSILFFDRVQLDHCAVGTNTRQLVSQEIPSRTRSQNLEPYEWLHLEKKVD